MNNIVAYCGVLCTECPVYIAARNNDIDEMKKLAEEYSSPNYIIKPEEVVCEGCCNNSKKKFKFCNECEIRMCGLDKMIKNCGYCSEYPCKKLNKSFEMCPENRKRLNEAREKNGNRKL